MPPVPESAQPHGSSRKWYVWAGYAGLGLPSAMVAASVAEGASPLFLGGAVVMYLPLLPAALQLRAFARRATTTDTQVALASACIVGACAAMTLLIAFGVGADDHAKRIGLLIMALAFAMLGVVAMPLLKAPEGAGTGQPPAA